VEVFIGDISLTCASTSKITHWEITLAEFPEPSAGLLLACAAGMTLLLTRRIRTDLRLSGVNYFFGLTTTISPYQRQLPFDS